MIAIANPYSMGIRTISSFLRSNGWEVNIIFIKKFYNLHSDSSSELNILLTLLSDLKTDLVGISVNTTVLKMAVDFTKRIQEALGIEVIWGGIHPTILPQESIQIANIICVGEGEYACLELLDCIYKGQSFKDIKNLWVRTKNGIQKNKLRPLLQDTELNTLPFPEYGSDNMYMINDQGTSQRDPIINLTEYEIIASRGCPYHCTYCVNSILRNIYPKDSKFVRRRSPENVVKEIENAQKLFPYMQRIRFQDEVFPWEKTWLAEFQEIYSKRVNLAFSCTYNPHQVNDERIKILKQAGLASIGLGIQSPSEKVRREIFEGSESNEQLMKVINILHKNNIEVNFDLIFDNPFEKESDKAEGFNFLLSLPKPFTLSVFSLRFFPEVTLTKRALADGIVLEHKIERGESTPIIHYNWKTNRRKEDVFWSSLFVLTSRECIPKYFVHFMSHFNLTRRHPEILLYIVIWSKYIELVIIAFRKWRKGQLRLSALKHEKFRVIKRLFS